MDMSRFSARTTKRICVNMPHVTVFKEMLSHSIYAFLCLSSVRKDGTTELRLVSFVVCSSIMKTEAVCSSEISTRVYQTSWRIFRTDSCIHSHCCEGVMYHGLVRGISMLLVPINLLFRSSHTTVVTSYIITNYFS